MKQDDQFKNYEMEEAWMIHGRYEKVGEKSWRKYLEL